MKTSLQDLMAQSGVAFGTSGARGLAAAMTDSVCYLYTRGFLQYLESIGDLPPGGSRQVVVGGDLRPSTGRIMEAVCRAAEDHGCQVTCCGQAPSPAVAACGFQLHAPSIMVTGSHIPDDRNGIKFNKPGGEILKTDELGMSRQLVAAPDGMFGADGNFTRPSRAPRVLSTAAAEAYVARYRDGFGAQALSGLRLAVYQHSAVGRDLLVRILAELGAAVTPLGRSDTFIPVDTEAIRPEDARLAAEWAAGGAFDAIVSTDGDSDRPLVSDEAGRWLRGDVAGILCARFLQADSVSTPVSCNTAVEQCGWFGEVRRTRIGSPFVVASMVEASAAGRRRVVGYEANGGFLLNSDLDGGGARLRALPTRDAVVVILGVLQLARQHGQTVSALVASLPARFTASDRLQAFPTARSAALLAAFDSGDPAADRLAIEARFGGLLGGSSGRVREVNRVDGLRITFENGEILHLRPSGNAPEFRAYSEAASEPRARELVAGVLQRVQA